MARFKPDKVDPLEFLDELEALVMGCDDRPSEESRAKIAQSAKRVEEAWLQQLSARSSTRDLTAQKSQARGSNCFKSVSGGSESSARSAREPARIREMYSSDYSRFCDSMSEEDEDGEGAVGGSPADGDKDAWHWRHALDRMEWRARRGLDGEEENLIIPGNDFISGDKDQKREWTRIASKIHDMRKAIGGYPYDEAALLNLAHSVNQTDKPSSSSTSREIVLSAMD